MNTIIKKSLLVLTNTPCSKYFITYCSQRYKTFFRVIIYSEMKFYNVNCWCVKCELFLCVSIHCENNNNACCEPKTPVREIEPMLWEIPFKCVKLCLVFAVFTYLVCWFFCRWTIEIFLLDVDWEKIPGSEFLEGFGCTFKGKEYLEILKTPEDDCYKNCQRNIGNSTNIIIYI